MSGLHLRRTAGGHVWQVHDGRGARAAGPYGSRAAALAAIAEIEAAAPAPAMAQAACAPAAGEAAAVCVARDKQAAPASAVTEKEALTPGLTPLRRRVLVLAREGMKPVPIAGALGRPRQSVYNDLIWLRKMGLLPPVAARTRTKPGPRKGTRQGPPEQRPSRAGADARPASPRRFRPCITCGASFPSEGAHNRMCTHCRKGSDDAGPFDRALPVAGGAVVR